MNFLGMGPAELVLLLIMALIIAGPKRMIHWMYILGRWTAKAKAMWLDAVDAIQREINEAGLDVQVPRELPTRGNLNRMARDAIKPMTKEFEKEIDEVKKLGDEVKQVQTQLKDESRQTWETVGRKVSGKPEPSASPPATTTPPNPKPATTTAPPPSPAQTAPAAAPAAMPAATDGKKASTFGTWTHAPAATTPPAPREPADEAKQTASRDKYE
jgi:Sec-independent protein translocase protein TatA